MMQCPACGSMMNPNKFKQPGDSKPDWICSNSACKNEKGFRTGIWNKKEHTLPPKASVLPPQPQVQAPPQRANFAPTATFAPEQVKSPTDVGEQMNRSNLGQAVLQGKPLDWDLLKQMERYVLTGKTPSDDGIELKDIPF